MFQSSVTVAVGDGRSAQFWTDSWLPDEPICRLAQHLLAAIGRHRRHKTVREALTNRSWVRDIQGAPTVVVLYDYVVIWEKVAGVVLDDLTSGRF